MPTVWRDRILVLEQSIEKLSEIQKDKLRYVPKAKNGFAESD